MIKLVLLRHGESTWNLENRFTGWTDVDLTPKGREEARQAGRLLREAGLTFDVAYTSLLKRAIRTLWIALDEMDLMWIPIHPSWRLNERHYGALQGLDKAETAAKYGDAQVLVWRRSYSEPPPLLTPEDERYPGRDPRYAGLTAAELPLAESLKDTVARFLPYWHETIGSGAQSRRGRGQAGPKPARLVLPPAGLAGARRRLAIRFQQLAQHRPQGLDGADRGLQGLDQPTVEMVQGGVVGLAAHPLGLHELPDLAGTGRAPFQQVRHDGGALLARGARDESLQSLFLGMLHGNLPAAL